MSSTISIMDRAIRLRGTSSAKRSQFSKLSGTWQYTQFRPSDAAKKPIVSMNCLRGIPLRIWTFLKTSSAMSGFCAVCCAILWARACASCTVCGRVCCGLAATHTTTAMTPKMIRLASFMSVLLLPNHAPRGIADSLIELVDLISRCAEVFQQAGPSFDGLNRPFLEFPEFLRLALPRSGVNLGVRDSHVQFENVVCSPAITLFEDHVHAVGI